MDYFIFRVIFLNPKTSNITHQTLFVLLFRYVHSFVCMPHTICSLKDASGTHTLDQCTIQPLSDPILLWSMRYRQLMLDAFLGQVQGEFSGDIFASVVRAEGF